MLFLMDLGAKVAKEDMVGIHEKEMTIDLQVC
jgi:hypothetical protein